MLAKDIMNTDIITINVFSDVKDLIKLLVEGKTDSLPVCDNSGRVLGMAGVAELIKVKPGQLVHDIMVRNFVSVKIDNTLEEIAAIFLMFSSLGQIPVFDAEKLVGVIKRTDILKKLARSRPEGE